MSVITLVGIALLGVVAAVGAATVLRRRVQAAREMPVVKIQDNETGARILRADGRLYWKFYDEYGAGAARTTPTLLPWGRVFHRDLVRELRAKEASA